MTLWKCSSVPDLEYLVMEDILVTGRRLHLRLEGQFPLVEADHDVVHGLPCHNHVNH